MRLAHGTRLGPYEILNALGAGGMGEVYKARDTRLDRSIAIKILIAETAASAEALERFEREAKTISQLSHPHICALYDVGHAIPSAGTTDSVEFLVMELLEGETLADRIAKGALPLAQALRHGIQICEALDNAHRHGIVHRDLKPANVMLTKSGVKLLDFGLAKATAPLLPGAGVSVAETIARPLSQTGTIAGTLQYMSPEQLEGRPVDTRSDMFALGVVLYEMTTGKKAFSAASSVGVAAAILHEQPPSMSSVHPAAPPALDRLVRGCLAKDPDERWQTAHDVKLQLASIAEEGTTPDGGRPVAGPRHSWLAWALTSAAVAAAIAFATLWLSSDRTVSAPAHAIKFHISPPEGGAFSDTVETPSMALSPDGSQLAYVGEDANGDRRIWIRPLSSVDARSVAGTDGARTVMWSPDGRSIGFFAGDKLKRFDPPDGTPVTLSDVPNVRVVGTWGRDDILYSVIPGGIYRVPAMGGQPALERAPDRSRNELILAFPWFLPDGRRYVYLARRPDGTGSLMVAEIGKPSSVVRELDSNVQYVDPGYLVFARDGTLLGQRFDVTSARVVGEPFAIAEPVRYFLSTGGATFATSRSGVLVYQSHTERGRVVWLDRTGKEVGAIGGAASHSRVRLSPDGRRVMFDQSQPNIGTIDIWLFDTERGIEQQVTSARLSETAGVWLTRDSIMFSGGSPPHLMRKDLGTNVEQQVLPPPGFQLTEDVSPDGKTFVFTQRTPRGDFDIWTMPINPPGKPTPLAETPFDEWSVRFSPDGKYLAFASNESGRYEVYVAPFPFTGGKTRVSAAGGSLPRWSRNGRELFYLAADLHLVAVPVRIGASLDLGAAQPLFAIKRATEWVDAKPNVGWPDFDVSLDGTKFLAIVPSPANAQPLTAVVNWNAARAR